MKSRIALLTLVTLAGCLLGNTASIAAPMGTAFTYQGRFAAGVTCRARQHKVL